MSTDAADEWRRVSELLEEAIDLADEQRQAWLERLREQSPHTAARLEALLQREVELKAQGFMEAGAALPVLEAPEAGQLVGQYTLESSLGAGGMGEVWLARRSDGRFEGNVAVKFLHLEASSGPAARRFETEGRLLATLAHPNIARLLDAGVTGSQQPYLVLEYVEGEPIDAYCDSRRLSVDERVRLFMDVLRAVAHAHARLVVHRDIKPSNIYVTSDGVVKLLDFGVAKLLQPADSSRAEGQELTRETGQPLTPEFAAPEQLLGEPVTTATDIYSLGLVLYELLVGRRPRNESAAGREQWIKSLTEDPLPPSALATDTRRCTADDLAASAHRRAASPATLRRALRGDLDNILCKALKPASEQRYATVAEFAADLQRFLDHEPVSARPASPGYRIRKFVRRNRGAVAAALLTIAALIGATVVTSMQMLEARRQRDIALHQQQRAQASNDFMNLLFEAIGPNGAPLTLAELLDRGVALLEAQPNLDEWATASVLYEMSWRYGTLGLTHKQLEALDRTANMASRAEDPELVAAARCATAAESSRQGQEHAAEAMAEAELALTRLRRPPAAAVQGICALARSRLAKAKGDVALATRLLAEQLRAYEQADSLSASQRALLMNQLVEYHQQAGQTPQALQLAGEIVDLYEATGRSATMRGLIAASNYALNLGFAGELESAASVFERLRSLTRDFDPSAAPVGMRHQYGAALLRLGRYDEALRELDADSRRAYEVNQLGIALFSDVLASETQLRLGRVEEAEFRLATAERLWRAHPELSLTVESNLARIRADLLIERGRAAEAVAEIDRLRSELRRPGHPGALNLPATLLLGARAHLAVGDARRALEYASEAEQMFIARARRPDWSAYVGRAQFLRARAHSLLGEHQAARAAALQAAKALSHGLGEDHTETEAARRSAAG